MSDRFFVDEPIATDEVVLAGPEAHHLLHVLRAKPGQKVILFDGSGREFTAKIVDCGRREAKLSVLFCRTVSREPRVTVTLGVALPKGERQRWLVEKAVELGVASLVPLVNEHSVSKPTDAALGRLRRTVIEASKQCGRTRLMQLVEPTGCLDFFRQQAPADTAGTVRVCAHPAGGGLVRPSDSPLKHVFLAVGPEGGFSDEEVHGARDAGWAIATLGPRILRVETAAVALASVFTLDSPGGLVPFDREPATR